MRLFQLLDILLEFKFVKLSDLALSGGQIRQMDEAALLALDVVQAQIAEATPQLQRYHQALVNKYGDRLRLRAFVVVAIGFERLVWVEG